MHAECTPEELEREKEETKRTLIRKVTAGAYFTILGQELISYRYSSCSSSCWATSSK